MLRERGVFFADRCDELTVADAEGCLDGFGEAALDSGFYDEPINDRFDVMLLPLVEGFESVGFYDVAIDAESQPARTARLFKKLAMFPLAIHKEWRKKDELRATLFGRKGARDLFGGLTRNRIAALMAVLAPRARPKNAEIIRNFSDGADC